MQNVGQIRPGIERKARAYDRMQGAKVGASMTVRATTWHGTVLAESDRTVLVEGNHYFPQADVMGEHLRQEQHSTHCTGRATPVTTTWWQGASAMRALRGTTPSPMRSLGD